MPEWKKEIEKHDVYETFESLLSDVKSMEVPSDTESASRLTRIKAILEKSLKIISGGDSAFVSITTLDAIQTNLDSVRTSFDQLVANVANAELMKTNFSQMEPHLAQILQYIGQIRAVSAPLSENSAFEKLGSIRLNALTHAAKIRKDLDEEMDEVKESAKEISAGIETLTTTLSDEKVRADNLITQFQTEFNSGQKERDAEFRKKVENEYSPQVLKVTNTLNTKIANLVEKTDARILSWEENTNILMAQLDGHVSKAGLVAQSIAQKALKTEYENTSATELSEARKWSWITLGIGLVMVMFVSAMLYQTIITERSFSPDTLLPKALLTAILVGIARWTAKLEKRHADEARRYKQLSLELETIAPFIATLDESEQREITKALVPHYFVGRTVLVGEKNIDDGESFTSPAQSVGDAVKNLLPAKE